MKKLLKKKEVPTKRQGIEYVKQIGATNFNIAELITHILINAEHSILELKHLKKPVSIKNLFKDLNEFPLIKPALFNIKRALNNKDLCISVKSEELEGNLGYFYTIILFQEESFPKHILGYLEIRVSQIEPEPSVVILSTEEPTTLSLEALSKTKDKILKICLKILNHIAVAYFDKFVSLSNAKIFSNSKENPYKDLPTDKNLNQLLEELHSGKTTCSIADVPTHQIIPFSYDYCFDVPLFLIEQAERIIDETSEKGILLYWNKTHFVMSDDYIAFLAYRKSGYKMIRAAIIGDVPTDLKIIKTGRAELLPSLIVFKLNHYDTLPLPIKEHQLTRYVNRLNTMTRVQDISECKCVVFSEDTNVRMLENILISSGFNIDETIIYSYKNCTNLDALDFNINSIRKIKPDIKIVIHRDRDYMTDEEIKKIENMILKLDAYPFITKGTDIESYYLNINHVHSLYKNVSVKKLKEITKEVFDKLKYESIEKIRKHEYGEKYKTKSTHFDAFLEKHYKSNIERFIFGKKALGVLISLLQSEIKTNPNLIVCSEFLKDNSLEEIAKSIWMA